MNILLIDDDKECLESLESALQLNGFRVKSFRSPRRALRQYDPGAVDAVITDYHLPGMTGLDIMKAIHCQKDDIPVIIISGEQAENIAPGVLRAGAAAFFSKPLNIKKIIHFLKEKGSPKPKRYA